MKKFERFLESFVYACNMVLPEHTTTPSCCILATRITIEVLRKFGYRAIPRTATCLITNDLFEKLSADKTQEEINAQAKAWFKQGAYSAMTGSADIKSGDWGNHLVAVCGKYLIDSSFKQFNRPQFQVNIPGAIWVRQDDDEREKARFFRAKLPSATARWCLTEGDLSYTKLRDFQRSTSLDAVSQITHIVSAVYNK